MKTGYICMIRMDYDDGLFGDSFEAELTGIVYTTKKEAKKDLDRYSNMPHLIGYAVWIEEVGI